MTAIRFDHVDVIFGTPHQGSPEAPRPGPRPRRDPQAHRPGARRRGRLPGRQPRRDLRADGTFRLRQVEPAALHQRPEQGQPRQAADRARRFAGGHRQLLAGDPQGHAYQAHRHGVPEVRPDALADGGRERRLRPGDAGPPGRRAEEADRREARAGRSLAVARQASRLALRRHAAARRPGSRAGDGWRHPADGRTVLGPRPADPPAIAGRTAGAATATAQDHRVRQPRPRRGAEDRHPHRDHEGRPDHPARQAGRDRAEPRGRLRAYLRRPYQPAQRAVRPEPDAWPRPVHPAERRDLLRPGPRLLDRSQRRRRAQGRAPGQQRHRPATLAPGRSGGEAAPRTDPGGCQHPYARCPADSLPDRPQAGPAGAGQGGRGARRQRAVSRVAGKNLG
ncbi:Uncharacterised protein [Pseudomonas aeruginosa]|nr:Uncharacterised protein [Pseudomonas aeruginosa]